MANLAFSASFFITYVIMVMGPRSLQICLLLQCGDRFQTSESDVYRRQILTSEVDPSTVVRVHFYLVLLISIWFRILIIDHFNLSGVFKMNDNGYL